jgi:hypothetical protein
MLRGRRRQRPPLLSEDSPGGRGRSLAYSRDNCLRIPHASPEGLLLALVRGSVLFQYVSPDPAALGDPDALALSPGANSSPVHSIH